MRDGLLVHRVARHLRAVRDDVQQDAHPAHDLAAGPPREPGVQPVRQVHGEDRAERRAAKGNGLYTQLTRTCWLLFCLQLF